MTDWYHQKLNSDSFYLKALNSHLTPMHKDSFKLIPSSTNLVESSHTSRNKKTGIALPLLDAIDTYVTLILFYLGHHFDAVCAIFTEHIMTMCEFTKSSRLLLRSV